MDLQQYQALEWCDGPSKKAAYPHLQKIRPDNDKKIIDSVDDGWA